MAYIHSPTKPSLSMTKTRRTETSISTYRDTLRPSKPSSAFMSSSLSCYELDYTYAYIYTCKEQNCRKTLLRMLIDIFPLFGMSRSPFHSFHFCFILSFLFCRLQFLLGSNCACCFGCLFLFRGKLRARRRWEYNVDQLDRSLLISLTCGSEDEM